MAENKKTATVIVRVTDDMQRRADELVDSVREDEELNAAGRVTRSTVLRLAMVKGLALMELERQQRALRKARG